MSLQKAFEPYVSQSSQLEAFRTLLVTIGGALIGASAISFSLVMFAMQINVERLPHGLFFRSSTDLRTMAAFAGIFFLSISVACSSLVPSSAYASIAALIAFWGTFLTFVLIIYAYRRALYLINPMKQLTMVIDGAIHDLKMWRKRAERAKPLLHDPEHEEESANSVRRVPRDMALVAYFQMNPHWTLEARNAVDHAVSFARRYVDYGDYQVSSAALSSVLQINASYVEEKGLTFFGNNFLFDSDLSTNGFINHTLEQLRQLSVVGMARGDEQLLQQTLEAMHKLVTIYAKIEYSTRHSSKTHALLAAGYLTHTVQAAVQHELTDVAMQGVRWMGRSALILMQTGDLNETTGLAENIGSIACEAMTGEKSRAVTLTAVEQLSTFTIALLQTKEHDIGFTAKQIKKATSAVALAVLQVPDMPLARVHSTHLAPYYSGTGMNGLQSALKQLANSIIGLETPSEMSRIVARNVEDWASDLHRSEKELLLFSIQRRSNFTFDIIRWIVDVTEILLAISGTDSCKEHTKEKLRRHALWLISTLSWIPRDKETAAFVECVQLTEVLFDAALDARRRGCPEIADKTADILLRWGVEAGRHHIGWAILERSLYGLVTLALQPGADGEVNRLKVQLAYRLTQPDTPDQEMRDRTARDIRERAVALWRADDRFSRLESAMSEVDNEKMRLLLEEVADLLSPETRNEAVRNRYIF